MVYTLLYRINTSCTVFQFSFTNAMLDAIPEGKEGESGGGESEGLFLPFPPFPFSLFLFLFLLLSRKGREGGRTHGRRGKSGREIMARK